MEIYKSATSFVKFDGKIAFYGNFNFGISFKEENYGVLLMALQRNHHQIMLMAWINEFQKFLGSLVGYWVLLSHLLLSISNPYKTLAEMWQYLRRVYIQENVALSVWVWNFWIWWMGKQIEEYYSVFLSLDWICISGLCYGAQSICRYIFDGYVILLKS